VEHESRDTTIVACAVVVAVVLLLSVLFVFVGQALFGV